MAVPAAAAIKHQSDLGFAFAVALQNLCFATALQSCSISPRHPGCGGARHPQWCVNGPLQMSHVHNQFSWAMLRPDLFIGTSTCVTSMLAAQLVVDSM